MFVFVVESENTSWPQSTNNMATPIITFVITLKLTSKSWLRILEWGRRCRNCILCWNFG